MKPGKFILDWDFKVVDLYDLQTNKCLIDILKFKNYNDGITNTIKKILELLEE